MRALYVSYVETKTVAGCEDMRDAVIRCLFGPVRRFSAPGSIYSPVSVLSNLATDTHVKN